MQSCKHTTVPHTTCFTLYYGDTFFDNFEQEICEEDEAYIYAILSRLQRILNWDPGEEYFKFNKQSGHQFIRQGLAEFLRWKENTNIDHGSPETQRVQHLLVYSLVKLCFYYWIRDSRLVVEILREMFECDSHFSSMFWHMANQYDGRFIFNASSLGLRKKEDSATVYFLYHAHQSRLQFGGIRYIDLYLRTPMHVPPAYLAAINSKPHLLLQFLRYGAQVDIVENGRENAWNLPMLLRHLVRILWNLLGEDLYNLSFNSSMDSLIIGGTTHNAIECLNIILRSTLQVPLGELNFLLMKFDQGLLAGHIGSHDFIQMLTAKGLVPRMVNRYMEPPELQHLCRHVIRNSLNANWNLPYGVNLLPLPKILKCYLSLSED